MTFLYARPPMRAAHPLLQPHRRYLGNNDFDGPFPSGILSMTKLVQLCASLRCLARYQAIARVLVRMQGHQRQSLQRRHSRWGQRFDGIALFVRFRFIHPTELGSCRSDAMLLQRCRLEPVYRAFPYWRAVANEAYKAVLPVPRL